MSTKTEILRRKAIKKKIGLIVKVICAVILAVLGIIYCAGLDRAKDPEKVYEVENGAEEPAEVSKPEIGNINKTVDNSRTKTDNFTDSDKSDSSYNSDNNDRSVLSSVEKNTDTSGITADGKVNINYATVSELCTLNGIGEKRAKDIIEYRETYGEFKTIEDIMKVKGIKQGIFSKIKDNITC